MDQTHCLTPEPLAENRWIAVSLLAFAAVRIDMGQRLTIACDLRDDQRQAVIRDARSNPMLTPETPDPRGD